MYILYLLPIINNMTPLVVSIIVDMPCTVYRIEHYYYGTAVVVVIIINLLVVVYTRSHRR